MADTGSDEWLAWGKGLVVAAGDIKRTIKRGLVSSALELERRAKLNATTSPAVRSGRLRSSIRGEVTKDTEPVIQLTAGGGSKDVKYARMQEEGGTVIPKRSKYLAIPLPKARTKAGVSRFKSPRDVPGLFMFVSKKGKIILAKRKGSKRKPRIEPWYVLVKSVTIKPKKYAARAVDSVLQDITEAAGRSIVARLEAT